MGTFFSFAATTAVHVGVEDNFVVVISSAPEKGRRRRLWDEYSIRADVEGHPFLGSTGLLVPKGSAVDPYKQLHCDIINGRIYIGWKRDENRNVCIELKNYYVQAYVSADC